MRKLAIRTHKHNAYLKVFSTMALFLLCALPSLAVGKAEIDEDAPVLLPRGIVRKISDAYREQTPPYFATITTPIGPDGKILLTKTSVTMEPGRSDKERKASIESLALFYSENKGRAWKKLDFRVNTENKDQLTLLSPVKTDVSISTGTVSLRAVDKKGRVALTTACSVKKWPPINLAWKRTCVQYQDEKMDACIANSLPVGCMFPLAADESPVDDLPTKAGDDFDIIASRIGFDDDSIYLSMTVQREISPGSLTPIALHQYSFIIMSPYKIAAASQDRIPYDGVMVRYLPLGETAPDFVEPCGVVSIKNDAYQLDSEPVTCVADGPFLFIKLDRAAIGTTEIRELLVQAHTGILRGFKMDQFSFVDFTPPTRIIPKDVKN